MCMKRMFAVLSLLLLIPVYAFAQTGTVAGQVVIAETGDPLANAAVFLGDAKTGAYTMKDGRFTLRNVPVGKQTITVSFLGYAKQTKEIDVKTEETTVVKFEMVKEAIRIGGIAVNETRAIKRETPIAFTDISQEQIINKYTTEDVPALLSGVPGLFSTGGGLGESELMVRGFDQDKVQIMINGIPVNDPESQQVYWSNWTGLSSNIKSVQVQRGAGSSMYGSGVFGGSINIETIGVAPQQEWTYRTSGGFYSVPDKVADGKGNMIDWTPYNYNMLLRYNSGLLYGGKFNYSVMAERKYGDSWQIGTTYDGWSLGVDTQHLWGDHIVHMSLIAAPQKHNQMRSTTDMELMDKLGRAYNRNNNPEQLNYYNKPQFSIRDELKLNENTTLMTNVFYTQGTGGGMYLRNDKFDVETGKVYNMPLSGFDDNKYFGRHARHIYETTGLVLAGYDPSDSTYYGSFVSSASNLPNSDYNHTWTNDSQNNHVQYGMNTYLDHVINNMFKVVVGGEWRWWRATHRALSRDFRYYGGTYDLAQDRYNYDGIVTNASGFVRAQIKPVPALNILLDGQYASYTSRVEEQPIRVFDYGLGVFTDEYYYATKDKFDEDDYEKTYDFFSPKFGVNYNITEYLNILANASIAYKEPKQTDWYSRSGGPDAYQTWVDDQGVTHVEEIKPEKATTVEFGTGYEGIGWNANLNVYHTIYEDKLESTYTQEGEYLTINAGKAIHQGVELSAGFLVGNFDGFLSASYAQNRWDEMDVQKIFSQDAEDIKDKVVPFSPEQMANFGIGYTFKNLTNNGNLRLGLTADWWDEYYGTYTNEYQLDNADPYDGDLGAVVSSKLPYYFTLSADISYQFKLGTKDASLRLDLKNINNREDNILKASYASDFARADDLNGVYYMYVTPAPLFHAFLTAEVKF